jgi:hypothetical protein
LARSAPGLHGWGNTNVQKLIKTVAAAGALTAATVTTAAADTCFLFFCWTPPTKGGGGSGGGGHPSAPEIDVTQGAAALMILAVVTLILREAYLRQRAKA